MATPTRLRSSETTSRETKAAGSGPALGEFGCLLGGVQVRTGRTFDVRSPYDGTTVAVVHRAGPKKSNGRSPMRRPSPPKRGLSPRGSARPCSNRSARTIAARHEELARTIALEAGKPIKTARAEVDRAVFTFKIAAEETKRIPGEIVQLDWLPGLDRREAFVRRVPLGPVAGITPFNFPLNLVAHKVAPALAAGNPVIIRPASQTPVSAILLGEIAVLAGWPAAGYSVVPSTTQDAAPLVEDERIKLLSFTGSPAVGWDLKRKAGRKRVTLELGGNAAVIVHRDANLTYAAERIVWGGSVRRAVVHLGAAHLRARGRVRHADGGSGAPDSVAENLASLKTGNPLSDEVDVGPVIDDVAADRIGEWLDEARAAGANVLVGGQRTGRVWTPTILSAVPSTARVDCQEVFAPIITVHAYGEVDEALAAATASDYGLQAGVFTNDVRVIDAAVERIDVGGLMINDVPTFRVDHMPYGGVKLSGFGREGVKYAIEEMTEMKLVAVNHLP